uniref:Peptidase A1 domain-containing protein n=1 Tax=Opuntia streptacantha TaxID=393608 RepID=A0A7C9EWP1_OPUST
MAYGNAFFKVEHKFKGEKRWLKELRAHDARRHGTMLGSIDLPLGGNALPSDAGLYFTKVQLGNPASDYHVQVDTGSDICGSIVLVVTSVPREVGLEYVS